MEPELTNTRACREWIYIINRVGCERADKAMSQLGNRKPYPLNIARILKLELPAEEFLPELESVTERRKVVGKQALNEIKNIFRR